MIAMTLSPFWCLCPESLFEKYQAASRLSIKRVIATYTKVSLVVGNSSQSLLNRRHWFNHAKVLSTTQRCGNTAKPFCPSARATDSSTILYCSLTQAVHSAPRYVPSTHTLRSLLQVPRIRLKIFRAPLLGLKGRPLSQRLSVIIPGYQLTHGVCV